MVSATAKLSARLTYQLKIALKLLLLAAENEVLLDDCHLRTYPKTKTMKPFLRIDEQLGLHLARPELAEAVFFAVDENRDFLRQWLPWVDSTLSVEDTQAFVKASMKSNSDGSQLITFILENERLVGAISVVHFNREHSRCEIGYWLRADCQGRGILTRTASAFIDYLFRNKNMNRLEIHVIPGNLKSRAAALRLGFQSDGVLRKALRMYGNYHDVEIFSLLKADWERDKKS